jgi:dTDP-4-dehydrorhamnose reductase
MQSEPPTVELFLTGEVEADREFLSIDLEKVLLAGFTVNSLATSAKVYQTIDESWLVIKSVLVIPPKPPCFAIACGADPIWSSRMLDTMSERIPGLLIHHEQSWTHWSIGQDSVKQSLCDKLATWCSYVDEGGQGLPPAKGVRRRCLITGATGYLGCQVVHDLLQADPDVVVGCLIRARTPADAMKRLVDAFNYNNIVISSTLEKRIVPLCGDITEDLMGMELGAYTLWSTSSDCIIHCAASINLNNNSRKVNTDSIFHVIDFASEGKLKGIIFISSIASCLLHQGPSVPESLQIDRSAATVGYGESKYDTERILAQYAVERNIPIFIVRTPQIIGSKSCQRSALPEYFVQASLLTGMIPDFATYFPLCPVEVISAVLVVSFLVALPAKISNLSKEVIIPYFAMFFN